MALSCQSYKMTFQFQTGAIRNFDLGAGNGYDEFQFQTGAIRSKCWRIRKTLILSSFNSKLVRLEGAYIKRYEVRKISFNSKLVRLEEYLTSISIRKS